MAAITETIYEIAADERYCIFCNDNSIENEIHFIIVAVYQPQL